MNGIVLDNRYHEALNGNYKPIHVTIQKRNIGYHLLVLDVYMPISAVQIAVILDLMSRIFVFVTPYSRAKTSQLPRAYLVCSTISLTLDCFRLASSPCSLP
ncbi:hypothetical protein [Flagellimonas marinaquae]|uniref:hypothetical protein n=1 Tax=Flagellimonas marinaquae TaxID=254955 RepID=UPI000F8CD42D|nr:hypothetical protein [Allomuricauda aquimarina]